MALEFEWNRAKAISNFAKHEVTFDEASTIFEDILLITVFDEKHSDDEDRFIPIGLSKTSKLLVVAHVERNGKTRIISARAATKNEENFYAQSQ